MRQLGLLGRRKIGAPEGRPRQIAQTLENLREFRSPAINTTRVSHSAILRAEPPQRALVRLFEIGSGVLFGRHEAIGDPRERRWCASSYASTSDVTSEADIALGLGRPLLTLSGHLRLRIAAAQKDG